MMASNKSADSVAAVPQDREQHYHNDFRFQTARRAGKPCNYGDNTTTTDESMSRQEALTALTVDEEKRLLRKVDWRLVPFLCMLYLVKKLDESNVSNARIMNKGTERNILTQLDITSNEYNLVTVLYTVPYILAEIPSNLLIKKFKPSRWQSRIMFSWGVVTACTAAVHNTAGLYACRFFLGLTEAGMFPGIILQLSYWYRPDEIAVRCIWISYGFHAVSGSGGLSGWQWLFAVEGIATVLLSVFVFLYLPDFPGNTKWLSPVEKAFLQARLPQNSPRSSERDFSGREIVRTFKDKRLWLFTLSWALMTCKIARIPATEENHLANPSSDIATAQILNIPISALSIAIILILGYSANSARYPLPLYPIGCTVVIVAMYSILVAYPNDIGVYIGMMIGIACGTAWFPVMWPWRAQTVNGATGSAFAIGFVNSYGQVGDALGPQMFQEKYQPRNQVPFGLSMGLIGLCGITCGVLWWITRQTEGDTRKHKLARLEARKTNQAVLDDVSDRDFDKSRD
ncbi:hypothetical protein NM208_g395 [Fusarium decemcellulare]|uniref:Uncharacterized protein n=2 Tax=Fusarium decemcellulare TaxID=57161 RepID=A0ACC1SMK1_9HYPO|nr:hypothetical protein NM208_g3906 [Fusarium decemcellulare]KAJ3549653.1 hypothetical protein NM208_g395 [Fusarium decemcellulare]